MKPILEYESLCTKPVGYTFDEELLRHYSENHQLEVPQRLMMILQKFEEFRLNERCKYIPVSLIFFKLYNQCSKSIILGTICKPNGYQKNS